LQTSRARAPAPHTVRNKPLGHMQLDIAAWVRQNSCFGFESGELIE
jgi:hypothetical protein